MGATTAQLGFRRRIGRDASWLAFLSALAPDLDVFSGPIRQLLGFDVNPFDSLIAHRSWSHSLLMVPLLALPVAWIWWRIRSFLLNGKPGQLESGRPVASFKLCYACIFAAILSHPLLDTCTSYGTQLLAPFSRQRFAIDAIAIVDLIYTPLLMVTLLLCYVLYRLKSVSPRAALRAGWIGFLLSVAYIMAGVAFHHSAISVFRQANPDLSENASYNAYPWLGTIFIWRVTCEEGGNWHCARVNVLRTRPEDISTQSAVRTESRWIARAAEEEEAKVFKWFSMDQVRPIYFQEFGRNVVEFHDMRYGLLPEAVESLWCARVSYDLNGYRPHIEKKMNAKRADMTIGGLFQRLREYLGSP